MDPETVQQYFDPKETQDRVPAIHPYPVKMVGPIARAAIEEFTRPGEVVLDPFCGSGTVLVEVGLLGRGSVGVDLNRLACLMSKVRTSQEDIRELADTATLIQKRLYANLTRSSTLSDYLDDSLSPTIPDFPKRDFWFCAEAQTGLGTLKALIEEMEGPARDFCLVAMSAMIKKVSNASALYKLTRLKNPRRVTRTGVYFAFREQVELMTKALEEYQGKVEAVQGGRNTAEAVPEVHCSDSRALRSVLDGAGRMDGVERVDGAGRMDGTDRVNRTERVDCIVTRVPSFGFDFGRCFKIHYWWLYPGTDILDLDSEMIGTARVDGGRDAGAALAAYYKDMGLVFRGMHSVLKSGGRCCLYTDNPSVQGEPIQASEAFCGLAREAGFEVEQRIERTIPAKAAMFKKGERVEELLVFRKA